MDGSSDNRRRPARHAFTLIELIAVIIVTAILAALTFPSLGAIADARAAGATHAMARDIAFARERAVNTGARSWLDVDVAGDSYSLHAETDGGTGFGDSSPLLDPATGRALARSLDEGEFIGVKISSASFDGATTCGFDWVGAPVTTGLAALSADGRIETSGGGAVILNATSGSIEVVNP